MIHWDGKQILMCNMLSTKFLKMFVEPEDHYNDMVTEAYKNWILDQEIEKQLGDNHVQSKQRRT